MSTHRTHLSHIPSWSDRPRARCGVSANPNKLTADPGQVTCQNCEKRLNDDLEPVEERIAREARQKARNRARSAAVTELVDRHAAEFNALWAEYTEPLVEEARAEVERDVRQRERWESERIEHRRAELEAELEALG